MISVVTLADLNYENVIEISSANHLEYCLRNDYQYVTYSGSLDKTRPTSWSKLLAIRDILPGRDWVMWIDADALFMNWQIKVEDIIDNNYSQIFGVDDNGINCGVFLFKNDPASFELINDAWMQSEFIFHPWFEQRAIHHIAAGYPSIKTVPIRTLQSHPREGEVYKTGDYIIHFSGCGGRDCEYVVNGIKKYSELAELYNIC